MASDFGSISSMIVGSILVSVCVSMATVAHIGKRFGYRWRRWRTLGNDSGIEFRYGLEIDGHGGAQWEAISVRFPTRPSDRFWFRSGFRWPRCRTSGSDLDATFAFISHAMWESGLDRPESPGAMVAHIARASLFVPRSPTSQPPTIHDQHDSTCERTRFEQPDKLTGSFQPPRPEDLDATHADSTSHL